MSRISVGMFMFIASLAQADSMGTEGNMNFGNGTDVLNVVSAISRCSQSLNQMTHELGNLSAINVSRSTDEKARNTTYTITYVTQAWPATDKTAQLVIGTSATQANCNWYVVREIPYFRN